MNKKGFTLIELLAVIVVLAIIALIAVPVILNVIEKARKGAFKNSVYGLISATELYMASENYDSKSKLEFICNGTSCEIDENKKLKFKGEVPKSGSIVVENGEININYIKNTSYCALGTKDNLDIQKDCTKLDITPPTLDVLETRLSSNNIVIHVKTVDNESGIKSIEYIANEKVDSKVNKNLVGSVEEDYIFDNLEKDTSYQIQVKVINGNDKETIKTLELATTSMTNPSITFTDSPTTAEDGYLKSQVANVTYNSTNISNPQYFVKTTRKGTSNIQVSESCGEDVEPGECTSITSTTTLSANTWYKVSGNLNVTYSEGASETGTIYAITYDGTNYSGATTGTISKIFYNAENVTYTTEDNNSITNVKDALDYLYENME